VHVWLHRAGLVERSGADEQAFARRWDSGSFIRSFRAEFGVSPRRYRLEA